MQSELKLDLITCKKIRASIFHSFLASQIAAVLEPSHCIQKFAETEMKILRSMKVLFEFTFVSNKQSLVAEV